MKARIPNQGPTGANMMKKLQEVQSNMSALQDELCRSGVQCVGRRRSG